MKKTTKQATNLNFPALKGVEIPFSAINFKFIVFCGFLLLLLTIPTSKIFASISTNYTLTTEGVFTTNDSFSYSVCEWQVYDEIYPATTTPWEGISGTLCSNNSFDLDNYVPSLMGDIWIAIGDAVPEPFISSYEYINLCRQGVNDWSDEPCPTSPIFSPEYPVDCVFSTTSTSTLDNFDATGSIIIPTLNVYHWFDFSIIAEDFNTAEKHYFSTSTDLDAGEVLNYEIPISLPDGSWKISYLLQGVYFETPFFASHWCEHTGIGTGLPLPTWKEITEAEFLGLEDCLSYPLLERLVCDLKNAIKRIFVPSAESITGLKTTIEGLKNKAPMSYISITKDFFDDVKTGINSSQDLTFKILNKTGNVSFAFWDNTTNFAGENQSFKDIFKTFFVFLLIFSFLIWGIFYVRKIFK